MAESSMIFEMIGTDLETFAHKVIDTYRERQPVVAAQIANDDALLTRAEVLALLHITSPTLRNLETKGLLQGMRLGRRVLFKKSDVMTALESRAGRPA